MGMEEGHGGGSGVQGDEGGRQGAGQAPGKKALPRDHLENIRKYQKISENIRKYQRAGQAPGQEALPWDHLENIRSII